ncbi:MAG: hypothetical protein HDR18_13010 [Lachnospiraceae bacterium]|nr:hypothetical protein [Lachnospiraceae bacterium]
MAYRNFEPIIGTIINMARGNDCCSQMMSLRTENGIVNFMITSETRIIDSRQLRAGLRVAAFYDASLPVPLIFPPQYRAQIITVLGRDEQVMINEFNRNLVAADNSLQLNIARNTNIETINGQNTSCSPGNQTLLVYYTTTTRSIPPQTTPRRVIILC